jgi:shikimate kinase
MMGSGKTTVGRLLAERLDLPFADSDAEIEHRTGRSVAEFFAGKGEAAFRDLEADVVAELLLGPVVLAAGGGVVTRERGRAALRSADCTVWLRGRPETLAGRVGDGDGRPLLSGDDVGTRVATLLAERTPLYQEVADLVVDVDELSPEDAAARIAAEVVR